MSLVDGEEGKKLADLDLTGIAPNRVVLLGPGSVRIATGDKLAITVEGDSRVAGAMRFTLKDGTLGILRKSGKWDGDDARATINVTMPAPRKLTMAGSGRIDAADLAADKARVTIAGSGTVETSRVETAELKVEDAKVDIAGSGDSAFASDGTAKPKGDKPKA